MAGLLKGLRAAFGDVEPAPYTVVVERAGYEERVYPGRVWACTTMTGPSRHALVTPMFRRLFSYISGRNIPNVRMDMTTPVTTLVRPANNNKKTATKNMTPEEEQYCNEEVFNEGGDRIMDKSPSSSSSSSSGCPLGTYTMGFLIPASHQDSVPPTTDKNIFMYSRPRLVVFVRRFSGWMDDEIIRREVAALREAIRNNGEDTDVNFSEYYVAGYDPPFKLLGRRNEVWVAKEEAKEKRNGRAGDGGGVGNGYVGEAGGVEDEELVCENILNDEVMS